MLGSELYQQLKEEIDKARGQGYNLMVVSVPGMGGSYLLRKYASENSEVTYINKPAEVLGKFNLIDLAMDLEAGLGKVADDFGRSLGMDQKMVLLVNTPYWLDSNEYQESYLSGHIYKMFWLKTVSQSELGEEMYQLSGGLPQLVKYLKAGGDREAMRGIVEPILRVISKCSDKDLEKLGIKNNGVLVSQILRDYQPTESGGIKINFDLSVVEDGTVGEKLTVVEAEVLRKMLGQEGQISKEEVSDIKWGEGKYDQFSDQAINKTMRRLNDKLKKYEVETIPKVGFRLKRI